MKFFYNLCLKGDDAGLDSDILSGVRKRYFADFQRIRDKITINSDADSILYDYGIEKGKPMSWQVLSQDKSVRQDVSAADEGRYYLCFYRDGSLYKRVLFSRLHTLLKAEYFDVPTGLPVVTLEPRKAQSGLCILYRAGADAQPIVLYPMQSIPDGRVRDRVMRDFENYTVSASTDEGIIRFLSEEQEKTLKVFVECMQKKLDAEQEVSYVGDSAPLSDKIKAKDFNVKRNLAGSLDISEAADFAYVREETEETGSDEADLVAQAAAAAIVEAIADAPAEALADAPAEEPSAPAVVAEQQDAPEQPVPMPAKSIMADGARYSYYGDLDAAGNRSGYGRTVTEEGRTAYEGYYFNDKRSGAGSYYYKDGSLCYTGEWVENVRHGVGVGVSSHDGSIHVGRWSLNKPEGSGVRLSADGEIRFVCRRLPDGTTVLTNYQPDGGIIIAKYDENGKKIAERSLAPDDLFR